MTQLLEPTLPAVGGADLDRLLRNSNEPRWLKDRRRKAWSLYEQTGLPDPGDEEWRRTDLHGLDLARFAPASTIVERSNIDSGSRATVNDLSEAAVQPLVQEYLYSVVQPDEWKYVALNAALWSNGTLISVPDAVELNAPVHLDQSNSSPHAALFPRTLIVVGRNARAVIIDQSRSENIVPAFVSGAVEIVVGDGAKVEYYNINRWGDAVYNFNTVRAILGRDAEFTGMAAGLGSKLTKMRFDVQMPQPGARTQLLGVTFGNADQHFDYNTLQDHIGDHTSSDLQFKSALTDSASLVWYGVTHIRPTAGGSEANQTSRNLLLSEHAKAAPIPILEIEAWDVSKCSHGATAGPVEESELFYLESRAIPRKIAEQMLVEGFFADVLQRVPDADVRDRIAGDVRAKFGATEAMLSFDDVLASV